VKILLLAPHPFYKDRGTPIAVELLIETLAAQGHEIDVLTYHEGEDRAYANTRIRRIAPPPFVRNVPAGISLKKLICDVPFFFKALGMVRRGSYSVVHATEESVFIALWLQRFCGQPYVYDMDSSLPQQVVETIPALALLSPLMRAFERAAIRHARLVLPVCDNLMRVAREAGAREAVLLRDISLLEAIPQEDRPLSELPAFDGVTFLYSGNLQEHQGIDLLLQSFALAARRVTRIRLVVVGGAKAQVDRYRGMAGRLGVAGQTVFLGPLPVRRLKATCAAADVLVSPRLKGQNTPMKIYTYLDSGRAVLATDLPTHTEVLNPDIAMLAAPHPEAFAEAMVELAANPALRRDLAERARRVVQTEYSLARYRQVLGDAYDRLSVSLSTRSAPASSG